jgi:hypothetical protein
MDIERRSGALARAALAALLLVPALASGQAPADVRFRVHPPGLDELNEVLADDARMLLDDAISAALARANRLAPGPVPIESRCAAPPAPACVAKLAGDGLVLVAVAREQNGILVFTLSAVDAAARVHGPVRVGIDPMARDAAPLARGLRDLDRRAAAGLAAAVRPTAATAATATAAPTAPPAPPAAPPPSAAPSLAAAPPKAPPTPRPPAYQPDAPVPGAWKEPTGKALTAAGAALVATGTVLAVLGRSLGQELEDKYRQGALTPADADAYARLDLYNVAGTAMVIGGGVSFLTGITLWAMAPEVAPTQGGFRLALSGRF